MRKKSTTPSYKENRCPATKGLALVSVLQRNRTKRTDILYKRKYPRLAYRIRQSIAPQQLLTGWSAKKTSSCSIPKLEASEQEKPMVEAQSWGWRPGSPLESYWYKSGFKGVWCPQVMAAIKKKKCPLKKNWACMYMLVFLFRPQSIVQNCPHTGEGWVYSSRFTEPYANCL